MARDGVARIGISGWRYPPWRGDFYPKGLAQRKELSYAASKLTSIEINGSFYSLQRPSSYQSWAADVPDDFVFSVKGGRFITHLKRLSDPESTLANFFASGPLALGSKLGPFLWQLPATLQFDPALLDGFLSALPRSTTDAIAIGRRHDDRLPSDRAFLGPVDDAPLRHALEPRHASFGSAEAVSLLASHGVALVMADAGRTWPRFDEETSDFRYARLHGADELYTSGYGGAALDEWARRVRGWLDAGQDAYIYFDNDAKVRAPYDAMGLIERLR